MLFINIAQAKFNTTNGTGNSPIFANNMEFWDFILLVISIFVLAAGVLSIVFVLYGGLLLILSWWKEDKIKPAINTIRYAIFWLIITVASIFLFPILWRLLWIDVERYAKPTRILEKIEQIWSNVFGATSYEYWGSTINSNSIEEIPASFLDL
jgi:H+/Cl- antiporter ClcA